MEPWGKSPADEGRDPSSPVGDVAAEPVGYLALAYEVAFVVNCCRKMAKENLAENLAHFVN